MNEKRSSLKSRKADLEKQIQSGHEAAVSLPKLETYIQLVRDKLSTLDFDMLNIKVWLDGLNIEITGSIPITDSDVVTKSS